MRESGLYKRWSDDVLKYDRDKLGLLVNEQESDILYDFNALELNNVFDIFYLLLFIFPIALFILFVELIHSKCF